MSKKWEWHNGLLRQVDVSEAKDEAPKKKALSQMKKDELIAEAELLDITVENGMKNDDIIAAIKEAQEAKDAETKEG